MGFGGQVVCNDGAVAGCKKFGDWDAVTMNVRLLLLSLCFGLVLATKPPQ